MDAPAGLRRDRASTPAHRRLLTAPPWAYGVALCGVAGALLYGVLMLDRIGLAGALGLALVAAIGVVAAGVLVYRLIDRQGRDDRADILFAAMQRFPEARVVTTEDGSVVFANAAYLALADGAGEGPAEAGLQGVSPLPALFGDDQMARAKLRRLEANALDGLAVQDTLGYRPAGGRRRLLGISAHPFEELGDHVVWALSDAGRLEGGAREAQLAEFVDTLPLGLYTADAEGRFTLVNRVLAESLGLAPDELVAGGSRLEDFLAAMPTTAPMTMPDNVREVRLKNRHGEVFPAAWSRSVERDEAGHIDTITGIVRDLTGELELEETLRKAEEGFRRFFDYAPVGIVMVDGEGMVVETNAAFRGMIGMADFDEALPSFFDLIDEANHDAVADQMAAAQQGEQDTPPLEVRLTGEQRIVQFYTRRTGDGSQVPSDLIVYVVDTTDQKALEAQFAQSQKMQAVGQLAGGIAHDFNNLLTAMIGYSDLLLQRHPPGDQSFADIMQIKQNANRAANLVRQLLAFSRRQTLQPKVLDLTDVLAELSHLLTRLMGETIELEMVHGRTLGRVLVDQGQIEQVIINLAVNARDAMTEGGTLNIRTSNHVVEKAIEAGPEPVLPGDYVLVEVRDTGKGIAAGDLDKIFEPFFTTKEVGHGIGLGLSTVYGIIKQTGGFIVPQSSPGAGTTFRIYLPRHEASAPAQPMPDEAAQAGPRDLTGKGTILLVEDEAPVRLFAARALENKGYSVLQADCAEAALELLDEHDGPIDLAITDVVMPRMDGPTMIKEALKVQPDLRVIFISGYAEDVFRQSLDFELPYSFLPKPFSLEELATRVKEVLA